MTVVNPKSISGINSITTGSGSDNLLTIHTSDASSTERVRINSSGDVIVGSGITVSPDGDIFTTGVTTATTFVGALTGNVTGNATGLSGTPNISAGTIAGSTGTFSGAISGTTGTFSSHVSLGDGDELRIGDSSDLKLYHTAGTANYIQASGGHANIHISNLHQLKNQDNDEFMLQATNGGSVTLYHNGTEKFSTQSYGIVVDGVVSFTKDANDDTTSTVQVNGAAMTSDDYLYIMSAANNSVNGLTMFLNGSTRGSDGGNNGLTIRNDNGPMSVGANSASHSNTFYAGAAGGGIDFSQTGDGSGMTSELLDDYEEGSWTPAVQFDSGGGGVVYGTRAGTYVKIGRMVHLQYYMVISSGLSSSDFFCRLTLPYTGVAVGHQDARVRQWNNNYSDWFLSLGGAAPVFFHSNAVGTSSNYARGDDVNGYALAGQYTLYI